MVFLHCGHVCQLGNYNVPHHSGPPVKDDRGRWVWCCACLWFWFRSIWDTQYFLFLVSWHWGLFSDAEESSPKCYSQKVSTRQCLSSGIQCLQVGVHVTLFYSCHACAILNGITGVTVMSAPPLISSTWFPSKERTTATAINQVKPPKIPDHQPMIAGVKCSRNWNFNGFCSSTYPLQTNKWNKSDAFSIFANRVSNRSEFCTNIGANKGQHWHLYGDPCRRLCSTLLSILCLFPFKTHSTPSPVVSHREDQVS